MPLKDFFFRKDAGSHSTNVLKNKILLGIFQGFCRKSTSRNTLKMMISQKHTRQFSLSLSLSLKHLLMLALSTKNFDPLQRFWFALLFTQSAKKFSDLVFLLKANIFIMNSVQCFYINIFLRFSLNIFYQIHCSMSVFFIMNDP